MAAKINHLIPRQAYEFVRDRIGDILIEELTNQVTTFSNQFAQCSVTVEGNRIIDQTEISKVYICLAEGVYDNQHQGSARGRYPFYIDVYCKSKTIGNVEGSKNATIKLHALIGLIRAILSDPIYNTLGFAPPYISRVQVGDFKIGDGENKDLMSIIGGRLEFTVLVNETVELLVPVLIAGNETKVKLGESGQGYTFNPIF